MNLFVARRAAIRAILATSAGALLLALLPFLLSPYAIRVCQLFMLATGLAVAWTILGGFSGYWSFGNAAFVGTGAFAAGLLELALQGWAAAPLFLLAFVAAVLVNGLLALAIAWPILRLRGIYFAIAMLGVSQVCYELVSNVDSLRGALGINLVNLVPEGMRPELFYYWALLAATFVVLVVAIVIKNSKFGYGLVAIREDEDTAQMLGVPTVRYKLGAFVISGMLTAMMGVIYGHNLGYITANSVYGVEFNLNPIVYPLLGGMGTIIGPVIGAGIMTYATQVLLGNLLGTHMFVTGLIIAVLVLAAPKGLHGAWHAYRLRLRRQRSEGR